MVTGVFNRESITANFGLKPLSDMCTSIAKQFQEQKEKYQRNCMLQLTTEVIPHA